MKLRLYHYWRSSSSWRVRWAFAYKAVACEFHAVSLLNGESESDSHLARNPLGFVPVLEIVRPSATPFYLGESMAILEWAEEMHPNPSLLPGDSYQRARIRQLSEIIISDTQPLQNLTVLEHCSDDAEERKRWASHWIRRGLGAYEQIARETAGAFSVGDELTLADICLVPQCYNAGRFGVSLDEFPTIARIVSSAKQTESYLSSEPEQFKPPE